MTPFKGALKFFDVPGCMMKGVNNGTEEDR